MLVISFQIDKMKIKLSTSLSLLRCKILIRLKPPFWMDERSKIVVFQKPSKWGSLSLGGFPNWYYFWIAPSLTIGGEITLNYFKTPQNLSKWMAQPNCVYLLWFIIKKYALYFIYNLYNYKVIFYSSYFLTPSQNSWKSGKLFWRSCSVHPCPSLLGKW